MTGKRPARAVTVLAALVAVAAGDAAAQTDYSPRIRSLGTSLAFIVEDPYTDAFLNPARVGDLEGRGFYAGRLRARSPNFLHPGEVRSIYSGLLDVFPPEGYPQSGSSWPWNLDYTPYSIGLVTQLSAGWKMSVAGELEISGSNQIRDDAILRLRNPPMPDELRMDEDVWADDNSSYNGLLDVAVGTGGPQTPGWRYGLRGTFAYNRSRNANVRTDVYVTGETDGGGNRELSYRYDRDQGDFERLRGAVSFGAFNRNAWFSQVVVGFGAGRDNAEFDTFSMDEYDEDYDGDGQGDGGDPTPSYDLERGGFASERTYDSGRLFATLGLRWGERVRSLHRLTYRRSNHDGTAGLERLTRSFETLSESLEQGVDYGVDGTTTGYVFINALGFADRLSDAFLFACGVEAAFRRDEFDEDGSGDGAMEIDDNGSVSTYQAPYIQVMSYQYDYWALSLPASFEWKINPYIAWRFGVEFRAVRAETDSKISQNLYILDVPELDLLPVENGIDNVNYSTRTYFASGVSLSYKERLGLELLTEPTSGTLSVTYVSSALLYFRF
jgi:hypothetical protein